MEKKDLSFFEMVHQVVKLIPYGRVSSYGAIARYLGTGQSARMVGWAMNASAKGEGIPAHRVVNSSGLLSGKHHFGHPDRMQQLLEAEGITIIDNKIQDFEKLLWEPLKELKL
jgi:methylated-DNA-protein-cysteine methyltransferase related protein